jgi:hypothetical protein
MSCLPRRLSGIFTTFDFRAGIENRAEPIRARGEAVGTRRAALLNSSALPRHATAPLQATVREATPEVDTVAVDPIVACGGGGGGGGGGRREVSTPGGASLPDRRSLCAD